MKQLVKLANESNSLKSYAIELNVGFGWFRC